MNTFLGAGTAAIRTKYSSQGRPAPKTQPQGARTATGKMTHSNTSNTGSGSRTDSRLSTTLTGKNDYWTPAMMRGATPREDPPIVGQESDVGEHS